MTEKAWLCECGNEEEFIEDENLSRCNICKAVGRWIEIEIPCTHCNDTGRVWYDDGYDACSWCDSFQKKLKENQ